MVVSEYRHIALRNGLSVLAQRMEAAASVSGCFYFLSGSRDEGPEGTGAAHFLEHMIFRGPAGRTGEAIWRQVREWGAETNAFTAPEATCFHVRTLPEVFWEAFGMLAAMVQEPALRPDDVEAERRVILEEAARQADMARNRTMHELYQRLFPHARLGLGIGSPEEIRAITPEALRSFHRRCFTPPGAVVVITGAFAWSDLTRWVERYLAAWSAPAPQLVRTPARASGGGRVVLPRPSLTRSHVCWGWEGPPLSDPDHYAAQVLAILIGDETGMSSRLHWALRPTGLCDRVQAIYAGLVDAGVFMVTTSTAPGQLEELDGRLRQELTRLTAEPPSQAEVDRARRKLATRMLVEGETTDTRMFGLARTWLINGALLSLEEVVAKLERITPAGLGRVLERYPIERTLTAVALTPPASA